MRGFRRLADYGRLQQFQAHPFLNASSGLDIYAEIGVQKRMYQSETIKAHTSMSSFRQICARNNLDFFTAFFYSSVKNVKTMV